MAPTTGKCPALSSAPLPRLLPCARCRRDCLRCRCCEDTLGVPLRRAQHQHQLLQFPELTARPYNGGLVVPPPAAADRAGAARGERGQRRRGCLHAHRPHRQGLARRGGLRAPLTAAGLLRRGRRGGLEGLLLCVAVPPDSGDAARHLPRLRAPLHRRRPRAGLGELPGPGEDAGGEGDPAAVRPLLLPLPQRRTCTTASPASGRRCAPTSTSAASSRRGSGAPTWTSSSSPTASRSGSSSCAGTSGPCASSRGSATSTTAARSSCRLATAGGTASSCTTPPTSSAPGVRPHRRDAPRSDVAQDC